jgi:hypothetical protein
LEQAIRERDVALAEVQTLRGILPICAFCKSIRDENDTWLPMGGLRQPALAGDVQSRILPQMRRGALR